MTMDFAPARGTRLTWHLRFTQPLEPAMRAFLLAANEQNFDRLLAHLSGRQP